MVADPKCEHASTTTMTLNQLQFIKLILLFLHIIT